MSSPVLSNYARPTDFIWNWAKFAKGQEFDPGDLSPKPVEYHAERFRECRQEWEDLFLSLDLIEGDTLMQRAVSFVNLPEPQRERVKEIMQEQILHDLGERIFSRTQMAEAFHRLLAPQVLDNADSDGFAFTKFARIESLRVEGSNILRPYDGQGDHLHFAVWVTCCCPDGEWLWDYYGIGDDHDFGDVTESYEGWQYAAGEFGWPVVSDLSNYLLGRGPHFDTHFGVGIDTRIEDALVAGILDGCYGENLWLPFAKDRYVAQKYEV